MIHENSNISVSNVAQTKSATISRTDTMPCLVIAARYRTSAIAPMLVAFVDQWSGINHIVTPSADIEITATATSITVTNNTTQGSINVMFIKGTKIVAAT